MPQFLPSDIASAIEAARVVYEAGHIPDLPFIAQQPDPGPEQAALFEALPPPRVSWDEWLEQLLAPAKTVLVFLNLNHRELCEAAQRLTSELYEASRREPGKTYRERVVAAAERRFGEPVPGATVEAQARRVLDAKYWRRFLKRRVRQARERLHLQLGLVGRGGRQYCSEGAREHRQMQLKQQAEWLKNTVLRGVVAGRVVEMPLEKVAKGPKQKLAKLYAFIAAMNQLAVDAELTVAMLTTTLEGEWHANPAHARDEHCWNGGTPDEANRELGRRFQAVRRDLDKRGIALSGLWCGEPHADGCPHRHHWLMYHPDNERAVLSVFLKHFPGKLKLRRGQDKADDRIVETSEDARNGLSRKCRPNEGAQVDVSIIDQAKSSGASYILKYVLKAVLPELTIEGVVTPLGSAKSKPAEVKADEADEAEDETGEGKRPKRTSAKPTAAQARKQLRALQSIDAHRSVWRMRSFQFFGVKNCLTLWDELRRLKDEPPEPELRRLWLLARGGDTEGRLHTGEQRGDAYGFLKAMGGLAAAPAVQEDLLDNEGRGLRARVYSEPTQTRYGEAGARIKGVELVQRVKVKRKRGEPKAPTEAVIASVVTRKVQWELAPKGPEDEDDAEAPAGGKTTKGKVGAAAPGKGRTAKP